MNDASDRIAFLLDDRVRLDVALACEVEARTKAQIARDLDREPGSLSAIATLDKHGALVKAGQAPHRGRRAGGMQWRLNPAWAGAVRTAKAQARMGGLSSGLDLVLVPVTQTHAACAALASGEGTAAWGIPLRGEQMGLLLCPSGDADEGATIRLLSVLAQRGAHGVRLHVDRVMSSSELRGWAESVVTARSPELSPPSA